MRYMFDLYTSAECSYSLIFDGLPPKIPTLMKDLDSYQSWSRPNETDDRHR
jgi:hypothetical protein